MGTVPVLMAENGVMVLDLGGYLFLRRGDCPRGFGPEIVNCYFHKPDKKGWATVKQVYPMKLGKVGGVYVKYRLSELPYATRWIARTKDEDAMGMCLPATCEHKGRLYCQAHREQRFLAPGKAFSVHIETGIL